MKHGKVAVAMSGGVDSSVSAALLLERGHDVIGVTMNLFSLPGDLCRSEELRSCCGWKAVKDAHEVALKLGIPHLVADFRREFEETVIRDFCREYSRGRTPNPCIRCNEHIKFSLFLRRAERLGADLIATGHHSRVTRDRGPGIHHLRKGKDRAKDQSYFLYPLTQEQLSRVLMPVGGLSKSEVREEARKRGLKVAAKPESQEVCFIGRGRYPDFLKERIPGAFQPGPICDLDGRVLGEHKGIIHFTVGQRRGLGISASRPLYVVSIDPDSRTVTVGPNEALLSRKFLASEVTWIAGGKLEEPVRMKAKIRYKHQEAKARVFPFTPDKVVVEFEEPQRAVTPGQSVVFYCRDEVLGGGIIDRVIRFF
ncbi:MAG: tRNA 2-thiouridine(34) synthase MnmA [Candidatus Aminicenantes bacterium]|nr:tRNA 2-thiouridine(34) synthase MnmA [Candidatus Aminicenantes bacterium]